MKALAALLICIGSLCMAQISDIVSRVNVGQPHAGEALLFQIDVINISVIDHLEFAYRSFGQSEYKRVEMTISGNSASALVPSNDLLPPFLEYYFIVFKRDMPFLKNWVTYPMEDASEHPFKLDLLTAPEQPNNDAILILSPEPLERLVSGDVFISFSLLRADTSIDRQATKTYLDGIDVSKGAIISNDLVVVHPPSPVPNTVTGTHDIKVEIFDKQGRLGYSRSWKFRIQSSNLSLTSITTSSDWRYSTSLQAETRNESISNAATPFHRLGLSARGEYNDFKMIGRLYVTNEEKDIRQPQNRYYISAELPWLKFGYGDSYPVFPDYILNGKRVRGFEGNLLLGSFNVDVTQGQIIRNIESDTIKTFPVDSLSAEQSRDSTAAYGLYDPATQRWAKFQFGTFKRDVLVVRPSFGRKDEAHVGFTYLKSKDDLNSIRFGVAPKEDLVFGSDLYVPIDGRHVEINGQAAISATNQDITNGTFTDQQIDSVYSTYSQANRDNIRRVREIMSRFITVNQNLIPLNLKNLPTLAYEGGISIEYFDNFLKATYLRRGAKFESFGQSFLQTDIQGYSFNDRLRLLANQLVLSGGFERLQDNTAETKPATTTSNTGNFSVSWFSRTDVPNMTFAFVHASNTNQLVNDPVYGINDVMNRFFVQCGKQFIFGPSHNATISASSSTRDDQSARNRDSRNTTFSLSNSSSFTIPLQTLFSLTTTSTTFSGSVAGIDTSVTYTTLYFNAQYRFLEDNMNVSAAVSPTFGDIARTLIDARMQYHVTHSLSLLGQLSFYSSKNSTDDIIWSLILRVDI